MTILVIGNYQDNYRELLDLAVRRAATADGTADPAYFTPDVSVGKELLSSNATGVVKCIFADMTASGIDHFVTWVRGQVTLFSVPIIGLLPYITDSGFNDAHAIGLDDALCHTDMEGVTKRLEVLSRFDASARPPITQGAAIIAHPDQTQRRAFARILRQAGFDTKFAADGEELVYNATSDPPRIIVAALNLPQEDAISSIQRVRETTAIPELPCVIVGPKPQIESRAAELLALKAVEPMGEKTPPDTLLFYTNELLRREALHGKPDEQRASPRVQYGALCAFRPAGDLVPTYGYTYNISFEGMYIKTFSPPHDNAELWLDLRLTEGSAAVHLRGKLVWTRLPDSTKPAPVPPGFGFRVNPMTSPPGDIAQYQAMYRRILEAKQSRRGN